MRREVVLKENYFNAKLYYLETMLAARDEDFRKVLAEWKALKLPSLVEREVKLPTEPSSVVVVIGPRQAGKTYRLF
ncbi:MAG: hypothetical protein ABWK01_03700 [Infirmifilum sp.]